MKIILPIILSLTFLTGCETMKNKMCNYENIPVAEPIQIDPNLFKSCRSLVIPGKPLTYESILVTNKDNTLIYKECVNKLTAAQVVLKKFSNQP